jgi:protein-S-isoprenylcysteine O-methyltransferase Ste14
LPLGEELTRSGRWLFRWRSYLPLAFITLALWSAATQSDASMSPSARRWWDFACLGVSAIGFCIRAWTVGHTPRGTSGRGTRGQEAETLNTDGVYSTVRHPLYLGNFFMGLGVALFPMLWWLSVIYALAFWLYYERIMLAEEAFLRDRFGSSFLRWAEVTPAFIPSLERYRPAELPFSLRNVLRREYNGAFAVVASLFLLDAAGVWHAEGHLAAHPRWIWIAAVGAALWLVALAVKRGTAWLEVPGR